MLEEEPIRRARIVDFDDTIFGREKVTRLLGMITGKFRPQHLPELTIDDIANLDLNHGRVEAPFGGITERVSHWVHSKRKLYPGVRSSFELEHEDGVDIFGATGRLNESSWVDMSERQIKPIKDLLKEVYYTPRKVKTAVSKAHAIYLVLESGKYDLVEMDDDDPRTIVFLSALFAEDPRVRLNYIPYAITSKLVSRRDIEQLPNVNIKPDLYSQPEQEQEKSLEEVLSKAHEEILGLETVSHSLIEALVLRIRPSEAHTFASKLHSFVFDKCLQRIRVDSKLNSINKDLAQVIVIDQFMWPVFTESFNLGVINGISQSWGQMDLFRKLFRSKSAAEVNMGLSRLQTTKINPYLERLNELSFRRNVDVHAYKEALMVAQRAGFTLGSLLANPNVNMAEASEMLSQFLVKSE